MSGNLKKPVGIEMFLPDFIDKPKRNTVREQAEADRAFGDKLMQTLMRKQ